MGHLLSCCECLEDNEALIKQTRGNGGSSESKKRDLPASRDESGEQTSGATTTTADKAAAGKNEADKDFDRNRTTDRLTSNQGAAGNDMTSVDSIAPEDGIVLFSASNRDLRVFDPVGYSLTTIALKKPELSEYAVYTTVCVKGYIYVISADQAVYRVKYSESGGTWETMAGTKAGYAARPSATALSNSIYVLALRTDDDKCIIERYESTKDRWHDFIRLEKDVVNSAFLGTRHFLYVLGGETGTGCVDDVIRIDILSSQTAKLSPMSEKKTQLSAAESDNFLYVAGGYNGYDVVSTTERYDPSRDQWTKLSPLSAARESIKLFAINKRLYEFQDQGDDRVGVDEYDIAQNVWKLCHEYQEDMDIESLVKV